MSAIGSASMDAPLGRFRDKASAAATKPRMAPVPVSDAPFVMVTRHVVLGALGGAGHALVRELKRRGETVRAVARRAPDDGLAVEGVEWVRGDITAAADAARVYDGATVVYLAAQPLYTRWAEDFPPLVDWVIAQAARVGARLVHVDNAYAYGRVTGPLSETLPARPVSAKDQVRARIADRLLSAHAKGEVPVTIGRASDYFGPNVGGSVVGDVLFADVIGGRTPHWIGPLDVPHSVSFIDDVARGLATLGLSDRSWGEVWHVPAGDPVTGRQFLTLACQAANRPVRVATHGPVAMAVASWFSAIVREVRRELYQYERPWVLNADKFQAAFGPFDVTPLPEAIRRTVLWYRDAWDDQGKDNS